jgi:hypothetical protein
LAGPWTISRDRQVADASTNLRGTFGRAGARSWRALSAGLASATSLLRPSAPKVTSAPARAPAVPPPSPAGKPGGDGKRMKARWAISLLAVMAVLIAALAWATVSLAERGIAGSQAAAKRMSGPLVIPAPRSAGGLPRRFGAISEPGTAAIVAELRHRFGAIGYGLVSDARTAAEAATQEGRQARTVTAGWTSGLYGQPGHLDPDTNKPAWVMYLGLDATARLGAPSETVGKVMLTILGPYAKIGPWRVNSGHRGGASNCTVAWLAQTMVGVCGWASDHSIGVIASPIRDTSVAELATLLIRMRYDLQRK